MNAKERVLKRLEGQPVDRVPNFNLFMTFAAHYINEPLSKYYQDYNVLVNANLAMVENFNVDIMQTISDPYRETHDWGAKIEFPYDDLPTNKILLLEEPEKIKNLIKPKPSEGKRMSDRLAAISKMKDICRNDMMILGWIEGSFAEAGDLRGISNTLTDIYERPEWLSDLLEMITEVEIEFAKNQIEAGADIIGVGDAIASQVSPDLYKTFILPYEKRIIEEIHKMGAFARLHICGDITANLPDMISTKADIIDVDWMVDLNSISKLYGEEVSFCGNFDPVKVMLQGTPDLVYDETVRCLSEGGNKSFSGAGCEIPDNSPHENLIAQNKALQNNK